MATTKDAKLRHDIADSLNPIAVSIGYLEKLIAAGRNDEALALVRDVLTPAMSRARSMLSRSAQESGEDDRVGESQFETRAPLNET